MKAVCPNDPSHKTFITTAHVTQEWVVDDEGNFIKDLGVLETTHGPDPYNCWSCETCHADAVVTK
jgi:hypothetical protein